MKIPPKAEAEIRARLSAELSISSDEITEILRRHGVKENTSVLQRGYRKRLGQQLMSSFRDENGHREIFAAPNGKGGMGYIVVDCCNDLQKLQAIQRRLQGQMTGLDASMGKIKGRGRLLRHFGKEDIPSAP